MTDAPSPKARIAGAARRCAAFIRRLLGAPDAPTPAARLGRRGEREAARLLKAKGYRILTRNYTIRQGEVDLVAFRDGVLAFVEVRSQTQPAPFDPLHTITRRKQRRVIKAAYSYMSRHQQGAAAQVMPRFDVVTVLFDQQGKPQEVTHVEGAFHETASGFS